MFSHSVFMMKGNFTTTSPHLAEVLADQVNMLTILGMGQVEFVLDQLTSLTAEGGNSSSDVTRAKVLQALIELAGDEGCRREIIARGEKTKQSLLEKILLWLTAIILFCFCCLFLQMTNTQFFALIATSSVSECMVAAFKYHLNVSFPGKKTTTNKQNNIKNN